MKTEILSPDQLDLAAQLLRDHQLVAFPTDTVYGLGTLAFDGATVAKLYAAKDRSIEKAIPILIGDIDQLEQIAIEIPLIAHKLIEQFWPGALTIVLKKHPNIPIEVSATETIGVRMPDLDLTRNLIRLTGPLAVTSANRSAGLNPRTALEVLAQLNDRIDAVIDGGSTPGNVSSTVIDCTQSLPTILREGALTSAVMNFLRETL
ncbi:MAG TPA: L-threonylcarbamoyladenylate synthase [Anaerolineae bacterium]|nr:L-threonylcarbamoyladenylate synthase [Anaerolineae bacterium]